MLNLKVQCDVPPPPPLTKSATFFLLAVLAGPAVAEQCTAAHIVLSQAFPLGGVSATEGVIGGAIIGFALDNCDNPGSIDTPREYPISFCAEIFDTTQCDDSTAGCLDNNVAGASGLIGGNTWRNAGDFKRCTAITERVNFASALLTPHDNGVQDTEENSIYAIMYNPTRHLRIPISDND